VSEARTLRWAERGAWHGAWTVTLATTPSALAYFVSERSLPLPWASLAVQMATFVPVTGALYGAGLAMGLAASRRRRWLAPPLAALGGALGGVGPGAFAAVHFGPMEAPFFCVGAIASAAIVAALLFGPALFSGEGVALWKGLSASAAPLVLAGLLVIALRGVLPELLSLADAIVLALADSSRDLALFGAAFGATVGLAYGGWLGCAWALVGRSGRTESGERMPGQE